MHKTGICLETGPAEMFMPRGQATTIGLSVPRGWVGVNGEGAAVYEIRKLDDCQTLAFDRAIAVP
jgi:hypothetical protein